MKPGSLKFNHWIKYNISFILQHFIGVEKSKFLFEDIKNEISEYLLKTNFANGNGTLPDFHKDDNVKFKREPVLLKGAARDWPAYNKWSLQYFSKAYGDRRILINNAKGLVDPKAPQELEEMSLKQYIGEIEKGTLKYLKLSNLAQQEKTLQDDLKINWLKKFRKPGSFGETFYMFIGGKGTSTPLHSEFPSNVYAQISGQKKWVMFKPEDRVFVDAKAERMHYFYSEFNPNEPVNSEFTLSKYAKKYEVILNPGDVLVVPPFTWHYVENISDSIAVAYKFSNVFESLKSSVLLTALVFLATKPNLFYSFFATRIKKDDYMLMKK